MLDFRSAFVEGIRSSAGIEQDQSFGRDSFLLEIPGHHLGATSCQLRVAIDVALVGMLDGLHFDIDKVFWISLDNLNCIIQHRHRRCVNLVAVSLKT